MTNDMTDKEIEELAEFSSGHILDNSQRVTGFIEGFKEAQSLNDKMFSLEDIKSALSKGEELSRLLGAHKMNERNNFIQSLQQKK